MVTTKSAIWQSSPDKVIGMRADWAEAHPERVAAVIRAMYRAGEFCADPANHGEIAAIMARPAYLDASAEIVGRALSGQFDTGAGAFVTIPDHYVPHASAANFPWKSHALWYYAQMVRWGEVSDSPANAAIAAACFRPDLYRAALAPLSVNVPMLDEKTDGTHARPYQIAGTRGALSMGPDMFFDGGVFDPARLVEYIAGQRPVQSFKL